MKSNEITSVVGLLALSAGMAYASCTVYSSANCLNPPLGDNTGYGYDSCGEQLSHDVDVTSIPTKTWVAWVNSSGQTGYTTKQIQCDFNGGNYYVGTGCDDGWENVDFIVYGSPENEEYPTGSSCPVIVAEIQHQEPD
jgi:hypothetical protein